MRLFQKKYTPDENDIVYEKWHTSFSVFQEHRFVPEMSADYFSQVGHGRLRLDLKRKNLFAWTDDPLYRYDNFLLTANLGMSPDNEYSAAGFLFRRTDDLSYYYFLISTKGHYRLDMVMNGMPSVLIDWTACPDFNTERFTIGILAEGGRFSLFLDDKWIGDALDDSLIAGGISFAGQNYDEKDRAGFILNSIDIESRPLLLNAQIEKLAEVDVSSEARLLFAKSQMSSGRYPSALIEIKKVLNQSGGDAEVLIVAADCCINLEMYEEATAYLDDVPESKRDDRYCLQRAGLLYMTNDFIALRDSLMVNINLINSNPAAANLLGNAEYSLGNWGKSANAYLNAYSLDSEQAIYPFNAARALEKTAQFDQASTMYGDAARLYFRLGEYDALVRILPFLERLENDGVETLILKAKLLFQEDELEKANKIFTELIKKDVADSAIYYLNALIESKNKRPRKAATAFKKAIELEPDYYLYHFKYSEYLFLTEGKYRDNLEKALELAPEDPWVLNLAGLAEIKEGDHSAAIIRFSSASAAAPEEKEIIVNHSEALYLAGQTEDAISLLSGDDPKLLNQRGNIRAMINDYQGAVADYESAFAADRGNPDIILNLAAACIEVDLFSRAEELLVMVLERGDNAQAFNLIGNLALLKGEYNRAEAAYRKAIEVEVDYIDAVCNLAKLYISRERLNEADMLLSGVKKSSPGERFDSLKEIVFRKRMHSYSCSACSREWVVPKNTGTQAALRLVGEPSDDMPAGICSGCGRAFCIGCAKDYLSDGRLVCSDCGAPLKLSEDWIRYLYHKKGF